MKPADAIAVIDVHLVEAMGGCPGLEADLTVGVLKMDRRSFDLHAVADPRVHARFDTLSRLGDPLPLSRSGHG